MCSPFRSLVFIVICGALAAACSEAAISTDDSRSGERVLRVCADPNNLPFSNNQSEGFENRIVETVAQDMEVRVEYTWFAQRRGFIRNTLDAGLCDLVAGVPHNLEAVETTRPYYRSTYVFVTREREPHTFASIDDPALKTLKIGVHMVGDDYSNPPPVHALARRNITENVSGYSIYGDYSQSNPPARLVEAVADGLVDVAIVWGPVAGYFQSKQGIPLRVTPLSPEADGPDLPFVFAISMGVRKGEAAFLEELERILNRRQADIDQILNDYGTPLKPLLNETSSPADSARAHAER